MMQPRHSVQKQSNLAKPTSGMLWTAIARAIMAPKSVKAENATCRHNTHLVTPPASPCLPCTASQFPDSGLSWESDAGIGEGRCLGRTANPSGMLCSVIASAITNPSRSSSADRSFSLAAARRDAALTTQQSTCAEPCPVAQGSNGSTSSGETSPHIILIITHSFPPERAKGVAATSQVFLPSLPGLTRSPPGTCQSHILHISPRPSL